MLQQMFIFEEDEVSNKVFRISESTPGKTTRGTIMLYDSINQPAFIREFSANSFSSNSL